mmetsp:Transcript_25788/g.59993  ORF Transcript_25788/g.59993 Transcript_25788/m.59993 type:complete len:270 (+) Transcript_25788:496-1305(+)
MNTSGRIELQESALKAHQAEVVRDLAALEEATALQHTKAEAALVKQTQSMQAEVAEKFGEVWQALNGHSAKVNETAAAQQLALEAQQLEAVQTMEALKQALEAQRVEAAKAAETQQSALEAHKAEVAKAALWQTEALDSRWSNATTLMESSLREQVARDLASLQEVLKVQREGTQVELKRLNDEMGQALNKHSTSFLAFEKQRLEAAQTHEALQQALDDYKTKTNAQLEAHELALNANQAEVARGLAALEEALGSQKVEVQAAALEQTE